MSKAKSLDLQKVLERAAALDLRRQQQIANQREAIDRLMVRITELNASNEDKGDKLREIDRLFQLAKSGSLTQDAFAHRMEVVLYEQG